MKKSNIIHKGRTVIGVLMVVLLGMSACKKKVDFEYDNRPNQTARTASNTRIVNLSGVRELEIDSTKLTSFMPPNMEGGYGTPGTMRPTSYFPETGALGTTYSIPTEFVGADGIIKNLFFSSQGKDAAPTSRPFNLRDYGRTPMDYYHTWFKPNTGNIQDSMFAIPRDVSPSADPQNFKIRLVNLGTNPDYYRKGGELTLAWADGTGVHTATANVGVGQHSAYIELPYGTYQFKVLAANGAEIPAKGTSNLGNILNPESGTLMSVGEGTPGHAGFTDNWLTYAPIKTYQPGGVYSIAVSNMSGYSEANIGSNGETIAVSCNSFQIISDISEPLNSTYARVQGVNVLAGKQVSWEIDQADMGSAAYGMYTGYAVTISGAHTVKALDASGAVLAEMPVSIQAGDNLTFWAYTKKDGQPGITYSANNLSGYFTTPVNGNDGSYANLRNLLPMWTRFMNFCPDLDEVSFTGRNGTLMQSHLLFAQQKTSDAFVRQVVNFSSDILVYQSGPTVVPGNWLSNVAPVKNAAFMANINLYKTGVKPNKEPGIYTVALIGSTGASATEKAKVIVIKHNR